MENREVAEKLKRELVETLRARLETMFLSVDENLHVLPILERMIDDPATDAMNVVLTKDSVIFPGDIVGYNGVLCTFVERIRDTDGQNYGLFVRETDGLEISIPFWKLIKVENKNIQD